MATISYQKFLENNFEDVAYFEPILFERFCGITSEKWFKTINVRLLKLHLLKCIVIND